jgi:hypothetical protein
VAIPSDDSDAEVEDQDESMLRQHAEKLGGLSQATAEALAQWRQLQRLVHDSPVATADLAWAWIAERQSAGEEAAQDIYRPSAGVGGTSNRYWQEVAQTRSGYKVCGRSAFTPEQMLTMAETTTLEDALVRMELSESENEAPTSAVSSEGSCGRQSKPGASFEAREGCSGSTRC